MAASDKEFTHYNCNHNFGGTVTARGFLTKGPMPTAANDPTSLPPKTLEIRSNATKMVIWTGSVWAQIAFGAWS